MPRKASTNIASVPASTSRMMTPRTRRFGDVPTEDDEAATSDDMCTPYDGL
jgi:hypothetical protein